MFPFPTTTRASLLRIGGVFSFVTCLAGVLAAADASARCAGDDSFSLTDPHARPSGLCKVTHFPHAPDGLGSVLFVAAVFFTPTLVALIGTVLAARRGSSTLLWRVVIIVVVLVALSFTSISLAHVGFVGYG